MRVLSGSSSRVTPAASASVAACHHQRRRPQLARDRQAVAHCRQKLLMLRRIHQAAPGLHHEARQPHAGLLQRLRQRRQRFITPEMKLNVAESLRFRRPDPIAEIGILFTKQPFNTCGQIHPTPFSTCQIKTNKIRIRILILFRSGSVTPSLLASRSTAGSDAAQPE